MTSCSSFDSQILIVRPGALGDTILSLPLLESVRMQHPGSRIVFLGTRAYGDLIPEWAEFQPIDHPNWTWLFASERSALPGRVRPFDRAYVVLNNPNHVVRNLKRTGTDFILHASSRPPREEHVVEHIQRGLGLAVPPRKPALVSAGRTREKLVWIHPGSGGSSKCVPLDFLVRFTDMLAPVKEWARAVTAGEEDAFLKCLADWETLTRAPRTRLLEQRPLRELCTTLERAGLFIGNDSGISHLAAALGVPSIVFFVTTEPSQWSPWVPLDQVKLMDVRGKKLAGTDMAKLVSQAHELLKTHMII